MNYGLKIESDFTSIYCHELSEERILKYFFFEKNNVCFVIDKQRKVQGIISLGDFLKNKRNIEKVINRNYLYVKSDTTFNEHIFLEAREIFDKYNIKSEIPIINNKNEMIGYIYDDLKIKTKEKEYKDLLNIIKNKIRIYKSSYYYRNELNSFVSIIKNTRIYIRNCSNLSELCMLLEEINDFHFCVLNNKEFYKKIKDIKIKNDEKLNLFFDFACDSKNYLYSEIYSLSDFFSEFIDFIENGEFSRLLRITSNPFYSLNDYMFDHELEKISYSACSLATKFLFDYFKKNSYTLFLSDSHLKHGIQASWMVNGVRSSEKILHSFSICDMVGQQIILNKVLKDKNVSILNIQSATKAKLTKSEIKRFETYGSDLDGLIDKEDYKSIKQLYTGDCEGDIIDYVKQIEYGYPVIRRFERDVLINADYSSTFVNIENGVRKTYYQPEKYHHTIYITGPCFALGSFVEDKYTIPSLLSKILMENGYSYRVVNLGIAVSNNIEDVISSLVIQDGDIFINLLSVESDFVKKYIEVIQTNDAFNAICKRPDMFFDLPLHCNRKGNEIYADFIYKYLKELLIKEKSLPWKYSIYDIYRTNFTDLEIYKFSEYIEILKKEKEKTPKNKKIVGSIVMNANPFTFGHEYLIDYALKNCNWLYLFIVEENRSFFQFEDRFKMVVEGCKKKKNISILPSGKFIASNITFPEYFQREVVRDSINLNENEKINSFLDFRIFASYIAPFLDIKKRFVGEEPIDLVTKQYNEGMKKVLSSLNIEVVEIPRKKIGNDKIISASTVRRLYKEKCFKEMKELIPNSTFDFLINNVNKYLK